MKNWMFLTVCLSFIALACAPQPEVQSQTPAAPTVAEEKAPTCGSGETAETCPASKPTGEASTQADASDDPRPEVEKQQWQSMRDYYDELTNEIPLTDEQAAKLSAELDALKAATIDWYARNGKAYEDLKEQLRAAQESGDNEKVKEILDQVSALEMEYQKISMEHDITGFVKFMLTEEQQVDYLEFGLFRFALKQFPGYEFSDEQKQQMRVYARKTAEDMAAAKGQRPDDFFLSQMMDNILNNVLTREQRITFETGRLEKYANASFMGLALTDEQNQQITQMAGETAVKLVDAEDEEAKKVVVMSFLENIRDNVLTEDQKVEMEAGKIYGTIIRMFRPTVRDPNQRKAMHDLCKEVAAEVLHTEDPQAKAQLILQLRDRIYDLILTDEQKNQIHSLELQNLAMQKYGQSRLTPEQTKRIEELSKQMSPRLTATPDAQIRTQLADEFVDSLAQTVLTPQQRSQLAPTSAPTDSPAASEGNPSPPAANE